MTAVKKSLPVEKDKAAGSVPVARKSSGFLDPWFDMRGEMDRMFKDFFGRTFPVFPQLQVGAQDFIVPDVDVSENDKEITISAELPGIDEKDVELTLRDSVLTVKGEKKYEHEEEKENVYVSERHYGSFQRSFRLPPSVDAEKVTADFDKGVLHIAMPKKAVAQSTVTRIPLSKK